MKKDNLKLGEASFRSGMSGKMMDKLAGVLSRRLGVSYNVSPISFNNRDFVVYRIGLGNGVVDLKFLQSGSDELKEIDIFLEPSTKPDYNISISKLDNFNQVIQMIEDAFKGSLDYDE